MDQPPVTPSEQPPTPGPANALAMQLSELTKNFGGHRAVDDLTLTVPRGSMFGVVGPNGAGKTTTLSMATGLLRPDGGRVEILGHDVWRDPARAKSLIGVLPDGLRTFDRLSGRELLRYTGLLHGVDVIDVARRSDQLLGALGLEEAGDKIVADYSAGMTKKIGLACALIHAPRVLVLDEPFEAVDPVSGQTIRSILHQFVGSGGTVVLSSHVMELVERLCDHVAVIVRGQVLAAGTVADVSAGRSLQDRFLELAGFDAGREEVLSWLQPSSDSN